MTTFKQFLLVEEEQSRTKEINQQQAIDFARQYCAQYIQNENWLYRGVEYSASYLYGDSTQGTPRVSREIPNYYNLILSNLETWQQYPPRNRSFICSTSQVNTESYGNPYFAVVPDNTNVAVFSGPDIWDGFPNLQHELGIAPDTFAYMVSSLHQLMQREKIPDIGYTAQQTSHNWSIFVDFLKQTAQQIDNIPPNAMRSAPLTKLLQMIRSDGVVPTLEHLFDEDIDTMKGANLTLPGTREVWFAGPAVFVRLTNDYTENDFADQAFP